MQTLPSRFRGKCAPRREGFRGPRFVFSDGGRRAAEGGEYRESDYIIIITIVLHRYNVVPFRDFCFPISADCRFQCHKRCLTEALEVDVLEEKELEEEELEEESLAVVVDEMACEETCESPDEVPECTRPATPVERADDDRGADYRRTTEVDLTAGRDRQV